MLKKSQRVHSSIYPESLISKDGGMSAEVFARVMKGKQVASSLRNMMTKGVSL